MHDYNVHKTLFFNNTNVIAPLGKKFEAFEQGQYYGHIVRIFLVLKYSFRDDKIESMNSMFMNPPCEST